LYPRVTLHAPAAWAATLALTALTGCGSTDSGGSTRDRGAGRQSSVIFFDDFTGTSLGSAWRVISRHGEYSQAETECNIPDQVRVADGSLTITTAAKPVTCGDFQTDGTVRHSFAAWPYVTGDIQWRSLAFTYGTVTVRAKLPAQATGLWPAIWLLGSNCQGTNPFTADVGYGICPDTSSPHYAEIDMVECDLDNWCQLALANNANRGSGGTSFPLCGYPVDANFHTFALTWKPDEIAVTVDGQPTGCSFSSPTWSIPSTPMFLIIQTQTGGVGGAPNDGRLPARFQVDFVRVTRP
jgi:beta-glucanase (GH16 family)